MHLLNICDIQDGVEGGFDDMLRTILLGVACLFRVYSFRRSPMGGFRCEWETVFSPVTRSDSDPLTHHSRKAPLCFSGAFFVKIGGIRLRYVQAHGGKSAEMYIA